MGTLETAKEAERGIIDLETLTKTNQDLIDTTTEVQRIQKEAAISAARPKSAWPRWKTS